MAIMIIIVLVLIILAIYQAKRNNVKRDIEEEINPYTTVLRIRPEILNHYSHSTIGCRDKCLFVPAHGQYSEAFIGSFQQRGDGSWEVFNDEMNEIGHISNKSDNIMFSNPVNKAYGCFTERVAPSQSYPGFIIDRDTYDGLADFEGDSVEAAAAFVCWAYISQGNKYSDFFH